MKSALWLSLALVLVCASAAHATIHETWQIDVSGVLNDVNGGQISINGVVYYGGSFAGGTYEQGLGILGLAHNGAFAGTLTLEVQYKESEYTPGEYQMDYDFYRDGWLITGATISLPTALGGTRTFTADFTNASTDSYRGLGWFNDAGEGTTDYPNAHPEMHEALRFVFPEYNGPGGSVAAAWRSPRNTAVRTCGRL
jgi:hypothetical protein